MCLEAKKQKAKNQYLFLRINCKRECTLNFFSDWNEPRNVLTHQEMYGWWFWRLSNIEKHARDDFRDCKRLCKIKSIYLQVNLKEANLNGCV